ncbi:MAG: hypothetical protein K2G11_05285, partial [Muribaculaceae bacterium]|nr:hypothetical protein [Muribaculaceae bacterium]
LSMAVECFHRKKDILNEAKARYYSGVISRRAGNYQDAMWEVMNAIDLTEQARDTFWMARVHDLAYEIFISTNDTYSASLEADKAAVFFKRAGETRFHRYALFEKMSALEYPVNRDGIPVDDGDTLLDSLLNVFRGDSDSIMLAECLYYKARKFNAEKDYENCRRVMDTISKYSASVELHKRLLPFRITAGLDKGDNVDNLIEEYNSRDRVDRNDSLSFLHYKKDWNVMWGNWQVANQIADSMIYLYSKVLGDKSYKSVDVIRSDYETLIKEKRKREYKELRNRHIRIVIALALIIMAVCGAGWGMYVYNRRSGIISWPLCGRSLRKIAH